jgi:hypothetical protein
MADDVPEENTTFDKWPLDDARTGDDPIDRFIAGMTPRPVLFPSDYRRSVDWLIRALDMFSNATDADMDYYFGTADYTMRRHCQGLAYDLRQRWNISD